MSILVPQPAARRSVIAKVRRTAAVWVSCIIGLAGSQVAHAQTASPGGGSARPAPAAPAATGTGAPRGDRAGTATGVPAGTSVTPEKEEAALSPEVLADEGPRYPPPSARWQTAGLGVLLTGVFYGAALGVSYMFPDAPGAHDLRTPVVGPWLAIGHNGCPPGEPDCSEALVVFRTIVTAFDGIGQAGGIPILLEGLFMRTQESSPAVQPAAPFPVRGNGTPAPGREGPGAPKGPAQPSPSSPTAPPAGPTRLFYVPIPMTVGFRGVGVGVVGRF